MTLLPLRTLEQFKQDILYAVNGAQNGDDELLTLIAQHLMEHGEHIRFLQQIEQLHVQLFPRKSE